MRLKNVYSQLAGARFCRRTDGSIAIFFALIIVVIAAATGAAVDLGRAALVRSKLTAAADAAALAAAQRGAQDLGAGLSSWSATGTTAGTAYFVNQLKTLAFVGQPTPAVTMTGSGGQVTATVDYSVQLPTAFMGVISVPSITISGTAKAVTNSLPFTDVHVVIDASTSMGIGATAADQSRLMNATGCTLACHTTDVQGNKDSLAAARASGAVLRIDVAKSAVVAALNQINSSPLASGKFRIAVYTLSNNLNKVYALSSDITGAINAVNAIDLLNTPNTGGTNMTYSLNGLKNVLPAPGTGIAGSQPRGFVMLLTDGVQNSVQETNPVNNIFTQARDPNFVDMSPQMTSWGIESIQAFDPSVCTPIKAMGYSIMTMNVTYLIPTLLPDGADARFSFIQNSLLGNINANMQACATTTDMALPASTPADIGTAVSTLFGKMLNVSLHLAQ